MLSSTFMVMWSAPQQHTQPHDRASSPLQGQHPHTDFMSHVLSEQQPHPQTFVCTLLGCAQPQSSGDRMALVQLLAC